MTLNVILCRATLHRTNVTVSVSGLGPYLFGPIGRERTVLIYRRAYVVAATPPQIFLFIVGKPGHNGIKYLCSQFDKGAYT